MIVELAVVCIKVEVMVTAVDQTGDHVLNDKGDHLPEKLFGE